MRSRYEEGDPSVVDALALGYPRFVYHPFVSQLAELIAAAQGVSDDVAVLPMPSKAVADRCASFIEQAMARAQASMAEIQLVQTAELGVAGVAYVLFPKAAASIAKTYWQHTGEVLSSRQAESALRAMGATLVQVTERFNGGQRSCVVACEAEAAVVPDVQQRQALANLKARIAGVAGESPENVFLCASGMASIFTALCALRRLAEPGAKAVVFGFPYLDTLKMCNRPEWCDGCLFYGHGDEAEIDALTAELEAGQTRVLGLFTEFPSNPLLKCPNLARLRTLADRFSFPIVVDDTIANFSNCDFLSSGVADVVVSSLTKLFSGKGDGMGGSAVVNSNTAMGRAIAEDLRANYTDTLFYVDAEVILSNASDFEERSAAINATTQALVEWLVEQPGVQRVHYPSLTEAGRATYSQFMRPGGGFAGLCTVICDASCNPATFYDALAVEKGPSLGTNFTLASPYTLLGHYTELDWARTFGVDAELVRVAVGLEDLQALKGKFTFALQAGRAGGAHASL